MELPLVKDRADAVLCLDVLHYLSDWELKEFLKRVRRILTKAGFKLDLMEPMAPGREETWFIAGLA